MLSSLDLDNRSSPTVEAYATQFAKQLKPSSAIVLNGNPIVSGDLKLEFQKKWLSTPLTSHLLTNFDCHIIPGTGIIMITATGKVRFDESGNSRLSQLASLIPPPMNEVKKPTWSSWFGFFLNMVVDESLLANGEAELINNFDYRITFKPNDSVIEI